MLNKLSLFNVVKIILKDSTIHALSLASQSSMLVWYLSHFIQCFKLKQDSGLLLCYHMRCQTTIRNKKQCKYRKSTKQRFLQICLCFTKKYFNDLFHCRLSVNAKNTVSLQFQRRVILSYSKCSSRYCNTKYERSEKFKAMHCIKSLN